MFFIRLFLADAWEKNWGSPCLFPHKLLWKMDMVLRSPSGSIICAAETGARYKIAPIVFEVCTRDQAYFRLFSCVWYRQHRNSNLKRVQQIPRNEVYVKIWWDFWVMNLYFRLFYSASVLFNSSEGNNAWQRNLKKRLLIPLPHMFACLVSMHSKMWIQQQTSCLHQRLVSLVWFWCYGGSYFLHKYSSLHSRSLNNICKVAIPGQIQALNAVGEP